MTVNYCVDSIKLDSDRITERKDAFWGDVTIFHDVVIASEIVQPYADGKAFKSRKELEAYAPTVDGRWVMTGQHPDDGIISDRSQIHGRTTLPRYVIDLNDPKTGRPSRAGVRADVEIFNSRVPATLLDEMKKGKKNDVSIGFFFTKDETAGVVDADSCKGQEYDYIQTNMFHDHLAAGIDEGRCPSPYCGIGADSLKQRLTGDPFAGFANFAECEATIRKENPKLSDEAVAAICGKLKSEHEGDIVEDDSLRNELKTLVRELLEEMQEVKAMKDAIKDKNPDWYLTVPWKEEPFTTMFDKLNDETRQIIIDAELCPTCTEDEEHPEDCPEGQHMVDGECVPIEEEEDDEPVEEDEPVVEDKKVEAKKLDPREVLDRFDALGLTE